MLQISCSDENKIPDPINPEELITTIKVVLTPAGVGAAVTLQSKDLDGDGPKAPVITGGKLKVGTIYNGVITLLNESEDPAEDVTKEVKEEAEDHQMFYKAKDISSTFEYTGDKDKNGKPIGLTFKVTTGSSKGKGSYIFTLRHKPNKSAANVDKGDITNAGGETDIEVSIPVALE